MSKVLECLIHSKLLNYILSNDLLSNCQHGFRPCSSTQEALLLATNDWHNLLSFNKQVAVVFFDIHKAFDSVPHHLLINSLMDFGVSGPLLTWFKSYLSNRKQRVVLDGESSALLPVTSGIPQGSILDPLLFMIYMNSISQVPLSPGTKLLYADDIVMYRPVNSQSVVSSLQNDFNSLHRWTVDHGLILNTSKSHLMPITRSRNLLQTHLTVDGIQLETVYSTKYLGVNISSDLTWGQHISITCKKKSQVTPRFTSPEVSSSQPPGPFKTVLKRDLPKLEYCSSVWDPHQAKYISMLESVQKFGCRVILQGMELRLSNTTNPPSVAYSTELQKTTKTHYVLQNSNKHFQYSSILLHPSSFTLPLSPP